MAKAADSDRSKRGGGGKQPQRSPIPPSGGQRVGARRFLRESWGELRKVQWPTRAQVAQGTVVVAVVTIVFATYIGVIDRIMAALVSRLFEVLG